MRVVVDRHKFGPWALVTGASSGIGKEFARQLAASGIHVVLAARRAPLLGDVGRAIARDFRVQYRTVAVDLTADGFMETLEGATRDLDIGAVISNAGDPGTVGAFLDQDLPTLQGVVWINVISHLVLAHHYAPRLAARGRGGLLMVGAFGAAGGTPYLATAAGTKAFVLSLGLGLHEEFQRLGLHLTVLLPGGVDTPVVDRLGLRGARMPMKLLSVEQCVSEALAAFNANRSSIVPGRINRLVNALVPSSAMRKMNGAMMARAAAALKAASGVPAS